MPSYKITTIGDSVLANPAREAVGLEEVTPVFESLIAALRDLKGAGLAAPQIGTGIAVAITEVRKTELFPDRPESPLTCLANPVIVDASDEQTDEYEGCFSVPDILGVVPRSAEVTVEYRDENWTPVRKTFTGYLARVVQHEIDHLNGRVYLSRMFDLSSLTSRENYLRRSQ